MPTSSIKTDIRIKDKAAAEAFVAALEESENRDVQTDVCVSEKSATEEIETMSTRKFLSLMCMA